MTKKDPDRTYCCRLTGATNKQGYSCMDDLLENAPYCKKHAVTGLSKKERIERMQKALRLVNTLLSFSKTEIVHYVASNHQRCERVEREMFAALAAVDIADLQE